jgi:hypothetical protein
MTQHKPQRSPVLDARPTHLSARRPSLWVFLRVGFEAVVCISMLSGRVDLQLTLRQLDHVMIIISPKDIVWSWLRSLKCLS